MGAGNSILTDGSICLENQIQCMKGASLPGTLSTFDDIFTYTVIYSTIMSCSHMLYAD